MRDLFLDSLTLEDGTDRLSRKVSNWLSIKGACLPRRMKIPRLIIFIFHCRNVSRYISIRRSIAFMKETLGYGNIVKHCFAFIVPCWNVAGREIFVVCLYLRNKRLNYSFSVRFILLTWCAGSSETSTNTEIQKHRNTPVRHNYTSKNKTKTTALNVSTDPPTHWNICRSSNIILMQKQCLAYC